jgi:aldose 1-epimerase
MPVPLMPVPPSGEQHEIALGDLRAVAVEVGGGLRCFGGVLDGYALEEMCTSGRGQVLMPWPNRIPGGRYMFEGVAHQLALTEPERGNAIHGLVRWASWHAVEHGDAHVVLEHVLRPQPGYPFMLRLRVEYRLDAGGLTVHSSAENVGTQACPFGAGHHPYVAAPTGRVDDLTLDGEPIGPKQLDETIHRGGPWRLEVGGVTVWADGSWPYVQLFTGDLPDVGRRALAVEPMTCPPDAFNTGEGLIRLEPGDVFEGRWGITVE